jgi:putative N6-adenine-specific DNA methylase
MIMLTGWDGEQELLDPMCGSGTIITEACMISSNTPAGYFRKSFGFEKWNGFDKKMWEDIKAGANRAISPVKATVYGFDKSSRTLNAARINIKAAGFENQVVLKAIAFEHSTPPSDDGIIVTNPPYGERIKSGDIRSLYKMMGDVLKKYSLEGFAHELGFKSKSSFNNAFKKYTGVTPSEFIANTKGNK